MGVGGKIKRHTALAEQASVEKGAKLDREGKGEVSKKAGEERTAEELTEEKEMKAESTAKAEREKKQRDKKFAERNAKADVEADMFKDAANEFGDGAEAGAKERERLRKIAKAEREKKASLEADRKKAAAEASEKAEAEKANKALDKEREASIAAKVEHIKKMRAEHKKK